MRLIFSLASLFLCCFLSAQNKLNVDKLSAFGTYLNEEIQQGLIAGAEVLVHHQGKTVWHKAFGLNGLESGAPLEKNSLYFIQSMTKPIMSVAIMQLVEQGRLGLDDPVENYLPEVARLAVIKDVSSGITGATEPQQSKMTIAQLLSHTAGFSHGLGENRFDQELFKLMYNDLFDPIFYESVEDELAVLFQVPLIGQPGQQWYYSAAPDLLAAILHKVTQQPIDRYLKAHIFDPLQMNDTGYNVAEANRKRVMPVYLTNEEGRLMSSPVQAPTQGNTFYGGSFGLFSSMNDYLRFCQMILNGGILEGQRLLKAETVALMSQNRVGNFLGPSRGFGLGFGVLVDTSKDASPANNGQLYWGGFFKTHFFIDPTADLIAIFMTQKIPATEEYVVALNRFIYGAME